MGSASVSPDPMAEARRAARAVRAGTGIEGADVAVVLGSGWAGAADRLGASIGAVACRDVPGFPARAVLGQQAEIRAVELAGSGRTALVFASRTHYYQFRDAQAVAHPVRVAAALGARTVVLTNGCGSLRPEWGAGRVVAIRDHLNLTGASPLVGARFVDMTDAYAPRLRELARRVDPDVVEGVYAQFPGPQYETPAEVRMAGVLGADVVGMSTALEAIAARDLGLDVLGLAFVTNLAAGVGDAGLSHAEVLAAGEAAVPRLARLLVGVLSQL